MVLKYMAVATSAAATAAAAAAAAATAAAILLPLPGQNSTCSLKYNIGSINCFINLSALIGCHNSLWKEATTFFVSQI